MQAVSSLSNPDILSGHDETEQKNKREQETPFHLERHMACPVPLSLFIVLRSTCLMNLVRHGNDLVVSVAGHKRLETTTIDWVILDMMVVESY
jgi:hypothetical protein